MTKQLFFIVIAFCIGISSSFYMGLKTGIKQTRAELISTQSITLKSQKSDILSLKAQKELTVDKVRSTLANRAHEDLIRIEMGEK